MSPARLSAELNDLVATLADFPGLTVIEAQGEAVDWTISCLIENTPTGEESLSWIGFVFDRKLEADLVAITVGGQHDEHPGQGCFSLRGLGCSGKHRSESTLVRPKRLAREREPELMRRLA